MNSSPSMRLVRPLLQIMALCLSTAWTWTGQASAATGSDGTIVVADPRPVAKAAKVIAARYHAAVSYEDPRYAYAEDLQDVTTEVSQADRASASRVVVPAGGSLEIREDALAASGRSPSAATVLQKLLEVQSARSNGGEFRLLQTPGRWHIVPAWIRDANGERITQASLLETPITIPRAERDGLTTVRVIATAIQDASGQRVTLATVPLNLLARSRIEVGADNELARDVLIRALDRTEPRLTWALYWDPQGAGYFLNMSAVPSPPSSKQELPPPRQGLPNRVPGTPPRSR